MNAVSVLKEDFFLIQVTNQTLCCHCNNTVVGKSSIFLLYITPLNLLQNQSFENFWEYITNYNPSDIFACA